MCRIAGIVNPGFSVPSLQKMVREMCDLQQHGGPDDEGLYSANEDHVVLGNRRLALLDLTNAGHQPMEFESRYTITYNGELYNFIELKNELSGLGHRFKTHTDTEVILAAFAQWDTQSFARLKGMYAFALWDAGQRSLFLVRDPSGIKPLYFSNASNGLCFASELGAFKPVPFLQQSNPEWPVYLMAYGHIPEPVTTLSGVKPLHKGCFLKYNVSSGAYCLQSFSHYNYSEHTPHKRINETFEMKMRNAVERHLIADAPIGVFLSGGLDSGIIATIASDFKKSRLNTFSLYFQEPEYSEKKYQDLVLQKLDCNSFQHLLKEDEFHRSFQEILCDMDMPGCDGINTWFISKYAKAKGLKAVLSGIGGDELFGGYPSFSRINIALLLQRMMPAVAINRGKGSNRKQFNRLSYLKMEGIKGVYLFLRGHFTPFEIAKQLGADEKQIWDILNDLPVMNDISGLSQKNQASWMEFNLYMQNQLLRDADVMGMAHGVEIRVPFLDDDLVRFAMSIPPAKKYAGVLPKQIMIETFKHILPREIWDRPKMGFSFPFAEWLSNSDFVRGLMENGKPVTHSSYRKFMERKLHWSQLMSLIILRNKGLM